MNQPEAINQALATLYPDARAELDYTSPFELLIATVLSAQSTDRRAQRRHRRPLRQVSDAAGPRGGRSGAGRGDHPAGRLLPEQDHRHHRPVAQPLVHDFDGNVPDTLDDLVTLPGVGRKTANVVLGNAFNIPGITPDTHLIRRPTGSAGSRAPSPTSSSRLSAPSSPLRSG